MFDKNARGGGVGWCQIYLLNLLEKRKMLTSDSVNNNCILNSDTDQASGDKLQDELTSDSGSDISLSDKIIMESNEKRLLKRMDTLQTSITNLKERLNVEKQLWKTDLEKIKMYQNQEAYNKLCSTTNRIRSKDIFSMSATSSSSSLLGKDYYPGRMNNSMDFAYNYSPYHYLGSEGYKRKLAETEIMCTKELNKLKKSFDDLKHLKQFTSAWQTENQNSCKLDKFEDESRIEEIYVSPQK